jgi:hypothetical protein
LQIKYNTIDLSKTNVDSNHHADMNVGERKIRLVWRQYQHLCLFCFSTQWGVVKAILKGKLDWIIFY